MGLTNWFLDRPIKTKLLLGFLAIAAAIALISLNSLWRSGRILADFQTAAKTQVNRTAELAQVARDMLGVRALVLEHVLAQDPELMRQVAARIAELDSRLSEKIGALEKAVLTAEEKSALTRLAQAWSEFKQGRDGQTLRVSAEGDKAGAAAAVLGRTAQSFRAADEAMDRVFAARVQALGVADRASDQAYAASLRLSVLLLLGGLGLSAIIAFAIARTVWHPVERMVKVLEAMEQGDLTQEFKWNTQDEMGWVAWVIAKLRKTLQKILQDFGVGALHVATAAQQLSTSTQELSSGAQQQAASLEQTSASLEQLTSTVKQNAESAEQASRFAVDSRDAADKSGQVVNAAIAAMEEITRASRRIGDITAAIDGIAFQTNLLALNAAVEAARAGEAGRGFAVVAAEVRSLAQRSASAAKEIKTLIQDSVLKVEAGSALVNQSGQTLHQIVDSVKRVADITAEIAATSREQAVGIEQVHTAMGKMDEVVNHNAAQTEELSAMSQGLADEAAQLRALVARFKLEEGAPAAAPAAGAQRSQAVARLTAK